MPDLDEPTILRGFAVALLLGRTPAKITRLHRAGALTAMRVLMALPERQRRSILERRHARLRAAQL